jgi:predicted transcriptional regulator
MKSNRIRRLDVADMENKMLRIVTEKDIFKEIGKSKNLTASFV